MKITTLIPFGVENANGRIYTKDSIGDFNKYHRIIDRGEMVGEIGHPNTDANNFIDELELKCVSLSNVSHSIKSMEMNNEGILISADVIDTPMGKIVKSLPEGTFVLSPRAIGEVIDGIAHISQLISFDLIKLEDSAFKDYYNVQL